MSIFVHSVSEAEATGAVADYYEQQRKSWGFLPNYALVFSGRADVAQAWNALNAAIREGMDRRRFEIATIAAARALRSTYCTAAHSKFLRDTCGDEATLRIISEDASGAGLGPQDRAVYEFATKVATRAAEITQADIDELRAHELSDTDVTNIVFAAAARSFFTRVLDGLGAQLDAETAEAFSPELLESMLVGRPAARETTSVVATG